MTSLDLIPNKRPVLGNKDNLLLWPELGHNFELNKFYGEFSEAEGWLGEGYLAIWSKSEVIKFRATNLEVYAENYHFFGSDGGGTQFGFCWDGEKVQFLSAPDIGDENDIRILGTWDDFLKSIHTGDYI